MVEHKQDKSKVLQVAGPGGQKEKLPYRVELWDAVDRDCIERVLARAFNAPLARDLQGGARRASGAAHHVASRQAGCGGFGGVTGTSRELVTTDRRRTSNTTSWLADDRPSSFPRCGDAGPGH